MCPDPIGGTDFLDWESAHLGRGCRPYLLGLKSLLSVVWSGLRSLSVCYEWSCLQMLVADRLSGRRFQDRGSLPGAASADSV